MDEIFDKVTSQHHFLKLYALLCKRLITVNWAETHGIVSEDVSLSPGEDAPQEPAAFDLRRTILDLCQEKFEAHWDENRSSGLDSETDGPSKKESQEDRFIRETREKTRRIGNVRFVAILVQNNVVTQRVIKHCCDQLMQKGTPEALEVLCALLETIGYSMETNILPSASNKKGTAMSHWLHMFSELGQLSGGEIRHVSASPGDEESNRGFPPLPFRTRALMKDILDLQKRGWEKNTAIMKGIDI